MKNLLEQYKALTSDCAQIANDGMIAVKKHNQCVDQMYKIIDTIGKSNQASRQDILKDLLNDSENNTQLWAACQILERLEVQNPIKQQALVIIQKEAKGRSAQAMGYRAWLEDWNENN